MQFRLLPPSVIRAFIACTFVLFAHGPAFSKPKFAIKAAPDWVRTVVPSVDNKNGTPSGDSSTQVLEDQQIRVGDHSVERYYHSVQKVETAAGLDDLSQLTFDFEPSYQQLTIHFVRIQRGPTTINALRPSEVKIIQQEDELDQQLYNGSLAALIFLNDLRVGDVVDYAYTVSGENPVLGGRFADRFYFAGRQPIQELVNRLIFPSSRPLAIKNINVEIAPTQQTVGPDTEYLWYRTNAPAIHADDAIPAGFDPYPSVSLSEFRSWQEVVEWALPLYPVSSLNAPELKTRMEQWKTSLGSPEMRAVAALRFVQDEIRYLGIELGRYSHQPTLPDKVLARRFGDCKDKALLLTSLLTAMGIEASPALVNSRARAAIDYMQPSPFAFDHAIVRAKIGGKTYWLDPTVSYQRGSLDKYYDPPFGRALVLHASTRELEQIATPSSTSGSIDVQETYRGTNDGPISFVVTTTYKGSEADSMRYELSLGPLSDLGRSYLNFYAESNASIRADGLPSVEDNENENVLVLSEKYFIDEFWKDNRHRFLADKIYSELDKPRVSQRSMPLRVSYPLSVNQTILIDLGGGYDITSAEGVFADDALRFEYSVARTGNSLRLSYSLRSLTDSVPVEKVQNHLSLLDRAQDVSFLDLPKPLGSAVAFSDGVPTRGELAIGGVIVAATLVIVMVLLIRSRLGKRRLHSFRQQHKARSGRAPETAFRLSSEDELGTALKTFACSCGQHPYEPESPPKPERFSYDGQRLVGMRLNCRACSQSTDLYFQLPVETQSAELGDLSDGLLHR